ncbi:hypothetical protein TrRE_jg7206 [Triparma retinervis]|uniref:TRIP4/RQT4 C2HC5-type zinc finger domain-containing protein n=1 Tax=Triparma retinervis TaxID=2557542 RepID=A0A9W6Z791_9STRA|nr:hypothetical protein TrRE_jg7206 [Triparma retinervis]
MKPPSPTIVPPSPPPLTPLTTGNPTVTCGCFGTKHPVLTNCLICGRLQCEKEGYGYCPFCKHSITKPEACRKGGKLTKEQKHKDRLLRFDREAARRTTVLDDQADYFKDTSSMWLEEGEREDAREKDEERKKEMHERKSDNNKLDLSKVLA